MRPDFVQLQPTSPESTHVDDASQCLLSEHSIFLPETVQTLFRQHKDGLETIQGGAVEKVCRSVPITSSSPRKLLVAVVFEKCKSGNFLVVHVQ
jgi:hypothetical protein